MLECNICPTMGSAWLIMHAQCLGWSSSTLTHLQQGSGEVHVSETDVSALLGGRLLKEGGLHGMLNVIEHRQYSYAITSSGPS